MCDDPFLNTGITCDYHLTCNGARPAAAAGAAGAAAPPPVPPPASAARGAAPPPTMLLELKNVHCVISVYQLRVLGGSRLGKVLSSLLLVLLLLLLLVVVGCCWLLVCCAQWRACGRALAVEHLSSTHLTVSRPPDMGSHGLAAASGKSQSKKRGLHDMPPPLFEWSNQRRQDSGAGRSHIRRRLANSAQV